LYDDVFEVVTTMAGKATDENTTENRVRQRIHEGQFRKALELCMQTYGLQIGRFCMAMLSDQEQSEAIVKEVFITAYDSMSSFDKSVSFRVWLFKIARQLCGRRFSDLNENGAADVAQMRSEPPADLVDAVATSTSYVDSISKALPLLKPLERDSVILHYQAGLSYREIGQICGKDEAAIKRQTSKALLRLRIYLKNKVAL
jgi:RNA polymerase sigma-70 factor, ECF subfamily